MASQKLYSAPSVVDVTFDASKRLVFAQWFNFAAPGHFRPCLDAQVVEVKRRAVDFIIVDVTKAAGLPTAEDQDYLVQQVFPIYRDFGVQGVISIVPAAGLTKLGAARWQKSGAQFGFGMYETGSIDDARNLVKSLRAEAA